MKKLLLLLLFVFLFAPRVYADSTAVIASGEYLDGGTATVDAANEGIFLPRGTDCSAATGEGQMCWDTDDDVHYIGTGSGVVAAGGHGDGANCSAGQAPLGVDAVGAVQSCTDFEEDLSNKAGLHAAISDVADFAEADGDVYTGVHDFGGADSFEVPQSAAPTTDATAEIALDTNITDHQPLLQYYDGDENMTIIALPTANLGSTDNYIIKYDAASDDFQYEADSSGGGGSTSFPLYPYSGKLTGAYVTASISGADAAVGAAIDAGDGNWRVLFDDTTDEAMVFYGILPTNYSSTPVINILYSMVSGTANEVEWEAAIQCTTPGDAEDIGTETFAAVGVSAVTVPGTAGHTDSLVSVTPTDDSCAANDLIYVYVSTDADDATSDDATGDRELVGVYCSFTGS
jgi:hypothetical protein